MKLLLAFFLCAVSLWGVEKMDPEDPKLFREQEKLLEKKINRPEKIQIQPAPGVYRSWTNSVKQVRAPADQKRSLKLVKPEVRKPASEQSFSKSKQWKPGRVVHLYEKSKDFDIILNPLSLNDFNRFIYQRNSKSP